jgi:ABC-type multidrug transport system fused ATPase/permease subunit
MQRPEGLPFTRGDRMSTPAPTLRQDVRRRMKGTSGRGRKLKGLLSLVRPYRGRAILMFAALVVGVAASLAPAPLATMAIDQGITKGDVGALDWIVAAFVASALIAWGMTYVQTYLTGWVGQHILQDLRRQIFRHLQKQPVGFYERRPAGVLISRMTNDVEALDSLVTDSVVTLFQASLTLIGTVVILIVLDLQLALITFLIFPIMFLGSLLFRIASADAYRRTRETIGAITAYLQESLSGIRVVRSFAQEPRHREVFGELNARNRDANLTTVKLNAAYFPVVEMVSALATVAVLLVGGYQVIQGDILIGVLVGFVAALNGFFEPINQLSQVYTTYQSGMAALDKIFELLDEEPSMVEKEDAVELTQLRGNVTFDDVSFAYKKPDTGETQYALRDVTLDIPPGQTVALVGATGAGKSTFAKLVARFYDPTSGRVLVDGHDLRDVALPSLRSQLGIVPQEGFLFSGTIADNIAFGRPDATHEEIVAAARAVGADGFIERLAGGYDMEVGERGVQLSAGQRQLLAFARALVADPRILILDEATANVDLHTESRIEEGLRRLLAGRTAIVIAHRLSTIRQAGRIVVLDQGRIVEQGSHDELIEARGAYYGLYRDWAQQAAA